MRIVIYHVLWCKKRASKACTKQWPQHCGMFEVSKEIITRHCGTRFQRDQNFQLIFSNFIVDTAKRYQSCILPSSSKTNVNNQVNCMHFGLHRSIACDEPNHVQHCTAWSTGKGKNENTKLKENMKENELVFHKQENVKQVIPRNIINNKEGINARTCKQQNFLKQA